MPSNEVGQALRMERLRRGQTVAWIAAQTDAPEAALRDLEEGLLPLQEARTRAYVRAYAYEVGLDAEEFLRGLDSDAGAARHPGDARAGGPTTRAGHASGRARARRGRRRRGPRPRARGAVLGAAAMVAAMAAAAVVLLAGGEDEPTVQLTAPATPASSRTSQVTQPRVKPAPPLPSPATQPEEDAPPEEDAGPEAAGGDGPVTDAETPPGALPPEQTRVQVMYGDVAEDVAQDVVATLEALGYQVPWVYKVAESFPRTIVYHRDDRAAEAAALIGRDPRFGEVRPDPPYSTAPDLHVVVGPDWPGGQ